MGRTTGRAICRLTSRESPRPQHEKTGFVRRAGCASSRLATPLRRAGAGRRRQRPPNGCLAKSRPAPTSMTEAKDGSDKRHDRPQPISDRRPFPMAGSEAKREGICLPDAGPGKRHFVKCLCQSRARGSCQGRHHRGAGSRSNRYLTCNQAPTYIRGPGPLD
jgi:hypothetical protein